MDSMKKTDDELVKDIIARYQELKADREQFVGRWKEAEQYVSSAVYDWTNIDAIPQVPTRYDSSPCQRLKTLVAGLSGYSISPNIEWFKLNLEDQKTLDLSGVKDWLEECERYMQAEFKRSRIYLEASTFIENAAVDGHAVMLIDEDIERQRLRFTTMRNNEIYLDVNDSGEVDTVFREYYMTVRNAVKFFGEKNLDESITEKYKDVKTWNDKIKIIYAVYPREEYDETIKDALNMPYAAVYVDPAHNKVIKEGGYNELPYAIFQWEKINGYAYGNSPAISAMPDIKALNIIRSSSLKIAQTSAEPPLVVPSSIRTVNLVPRGRTYVDDPTRDIIQPIKTGENYPITLQVLDNYEQKVKDWFFVDFFLMLQSKQAQMTATEVMELQGEKSATLSSIVVALNDALNTIILRSFNILLRANRLPALPETLAGTDRNTLKIDFVGPLSQAQAKYHAAGGISSALNLIGPIMELFPNSADYIDADKLMIRAMEGQGMPQACIREEDEVEKLRTIRAQQAAQQQAEAQRQNMLQNVMSNASNLGRAPEEGSIMSELNNQLRGGIGV